jgi:hypothetical protein
MGTYDPDMTQYRGPAILPDQTIWNWYTRSQPHNVHFCLCGKRLAWCACDRCKADPDYPFCHTPIQWDFCHCSITMTRELEGIVEEALTGTT